MVLLLFVILDIFAHGCSAKHTHAFINTNHQIVYRTFILPKLLLLLVALEVVLVVAFVVRQCVLYDLRITSRHAQPIIKY